MTETKELVSLAAELAKVSGRLLFDSVGRRKSPGELAGRAGRKTSATDLVTAADRASERLIVDRLHALRPEDGILGEEGSKRRGKSGLTWIIDPIDGTTNFVYAFPAWSVSVAVADKKGALAGAVYDAVAGEMFTAGRKEGAYLNGKRLGKLNSPSLAESLIGTGFSYSAEIRLAQAKLLPKVLPNVRDIRRAGAASLDLCYVGAGRLDGYYEAMLQPWDRAAGLLVATESGAASSDVEGLVPGHSTLVVAQPTLIDPLVELLTTAAKAS
jgi:myo-inositol-1(or 4)-monophosphatase